MGLVGGAVVREDALDADATVGEPGHRTAENSDRGVGFLFGMDLGVGDARMVVDDRVHEPGTQPWLVTVVPVACAGGGGLAVAFTLNAADEVPTATVGNVAELRDIDVDQRPGMVVLVAADRLSCDPVDR